MSALAAERGVRIRAETTVGAALPILETYAKLVESGDRVRRIDACPSGTLGYLFDELGRDVKFSAALRGAMERGYTEPDSRDDLSGMDVARKALILGRILGFSGKLSDVAVELLVPKGCCADAARALSLDAGDVGRCVGGARRAGDAAHGKGGLMVANAESPMASLPGTDNQFVFTSDRYRTNPMVISGPDAEPAVTASGVLNDLLQLAARGR